MMKRILVADDDRRILDLASFILKNNGYEVVTAADGLEALEKTIRHKPDLLLLDIMMPEMQGFSVCEHIRTDERLKHIKVVMISAKLYPQDHALAKQAGADGFISKPFDIYEVLDIIKELLGSSVFRASTHPRRGGHAGHRVGMAV
jgi:two-component system, OmpR family, alkaline phosphatase synthesis response regulator PhoP